MLRFIHAADFHLDSAFTGLNEQQARQRRQESRDLTRRMVEYANDHGVQLMLLAGDLFDSDSIYGQTAEELAAALAEFRGHVVIAPGNHDCYTAASPYARTLWPDNVLIFTAPEMLSMRLSFPQYGCTVYGAAFTAPEMPESAELAGIAEQDGNVAIGILHGEAGVKDLSGPVGIVSTMTQVGEQAATTRAAVENIAYLAALIAVNLAVMNLLPLPALDGGKIFFLVINAVSMQLFKKQIPAKYENYIHFAGLILLLALMAVITFSDVWKLIH